LNQQGREFVEIFLQEASERLQFLREYSGILQDAYPPAQDVERLYIAAHTLAGTSASYGFPLFSEVASKLAHIFQYAMNATIATDAAAPLLEFINEAVALLESDLIILSAHSVEAGEDIDAFKQRYPFAFQTTAPAEEPMLEEVENVVELASADAEGAVTEPAEMYAPDFVTEEPAAFNQAPVEAQSDFMLAPAPVETHAQILERFVAAPQADEMPQDDEVSAEIMEFFVPEAEEHLQVVTDCLLSLETNPGEEQVHRLLRAMHTVKGSSAQVGLHRISHVAHRAEDLIGRLRDGVLRPSAEIVDICLEAVDVLKKFLYRQWADDAQMQAGVQPLFARIDRLVSGQQPAPAEAPPEIMPVRVLEPDEARLLAEYADARAFAAAAPKSEFETPEEDARKGPTAVPHSRSVRVALERLDRMMNAVGELVINRTRMIGRLAELERLADVLNLSKTRMNDKVSEFQDKYEFSRIHASGFRLGSGMPGNFSGSPNHSLNVGGGYGGPVHPQDPADFTELEMDRYDDFSILSRSLTEISADISEVLTQMGGFVRRVDSDIDEFTKLAHRLQDEITQARMVPIGNLYTRLSRTVRDASKAVGKRVELVLEGAETELDNNIIQQISDPLIHLVRNAVAHGIERDEERYESGKSDVGTVTVRAYHRGNHIFVEVEDDGRGIDYEKVRALAVERGMIYEEHAAGMTEPELLELLFQPGFSTSPHKTELAGRGVGLDVVRSNVAQLNGEIAVDTAKGRGSRFTVKVPLTLIISQALFVRCGETMFAIPLAFVEEVRRVKVEDLKEDDGKLTTVVRDLPLEVVRVDVTLGLEPIQPVSGYYRMVIVNAASRQVALIVEDVVRKDEIVVKNLGEYLRKVKMFPGATIAPDGSLILLLDVNRLVAGEALEHVEAVARANAMITPNVTRIFAPGAEAVAHGAIPQEAMDPVVEEKVVVLADDSISVRKFVGKMLEKAGYRVKLAADGMEALEVIAQTRCDLVVTDLEMPRTNGYELLAHLRQDPATRNIPVMVVTSRAGAKHRDRAMKEGAAAFLTKPVQEDHFIAAVGRLIGAGASTQTKVGAAH
jgi:chemotaxis protein histidine kinase CheA/ActR/RegA family two-component response regulator